MAGFDSPASVYFSPHFHLVAFARDPDDLGVLHEAILNVSGGRDIPDQIAHSSSGSVSRPDRGKHLVTPHLDLEEMLTSPARQFLNSDVTDDQELKLEVFVQT